MPIPDALENPRYFDYSDTIPINRPITSVQARISAVYMHCACHMLNLALNNACAVSNILRTLSTTNDVIKFF